MSQNAMYEEKKTESNIQRRTRNLDKDQDEMLQSIIKGSREKIRRDIRQEDNNKKTMEIQIKVSNGTDKVLITARKGQTIGEIYNIPENNKIFQRI